MLYLIGYRGCVSSIAATPDIIIASEIVYLSHLHKALLLTLKHRLSQGASFILAFKQRGLGEERFFRLATKMNLSHNFVERRFMHHEFQTNDEYQIVEIKQRSDHVFSK